MGNSATRHDRKSPVGAGITREQLKAELRQAMADLDDAEVVLESRLAKLKKLHGPLEKTKPGRPPIWKGSVGADLVTAVERGVLREIGALGAGQSLLRLIVWPGRPKRRFYNLAKVIRRAVKTDPTLQKHRAVLERLSDRGTASTLSASCQLLVRAPLRSRLRPLQGIVHTGATRPRSGSSPVQRSRRDEG